MPGVVVTDLKSAAAGSHPIFVESPENVKSFSQLSKSGKMVNMYNAFKMAELSSKN